MKKHFQKFLKLLMLVAAIFSSFSIVNAETAPDSLSMSYYNVSNLPMKFPATFHAKKTSNGRYAYCSYYAKRPPVASVGYRRGSLVADNGISYIVNQGYSASNDSEFFIYQTALWTYMLDKNIMPLPYYDLYVFRNNLNSTNTAVANRIKNIISEAKKAGAVNTSAPTISLDTSNVKFTYDASTKSYVSSAITVKNSTNNNFKVTLDGAPNGTSTKVTGDKLVITVPRDGITSLKTTITINVSNSRTYYQSYYYNPTNSAYQVMVVPFKTTKTANASAKVTLNHTSSIDIIKVDGNGTPLKNAVLQVVNGSGKVIDKWTSDGNKHVVSGLTEGTYVLSEVSAPSAYRLSTQKIQFTVNANGKVLDSNNKTITLIEFKNLQTSMTISKQDITNKKELPGATLILKDGSGKEVTRWVSTNEPHVIKRLPQGTYTLSEVTAPNGYVLSTETITFKLDVYGNLHDANGNAVDRIVMYNKPEEKKICKYENGKYYGSNGNVVTEDQYKKECLKICKYENGKYYGSNGNVVTEEQYKNECLKICKYENGKYYGSNGNVVTEEQYRIECGKRQVVISKKDATNNKELPGATLVLKDESGSVIDTWVSGNEAHVIEGLKAGNYVLTETIAPEGYVLSTESVTFTVKEDASVTSVVMLNKPVEPVVPDKPYVPPVVPVEVPVENTASFKTVTSSIFGILLASIGAVMLVKSTKKRDE